MRVQKENSPKTVPTRPAGLRRGAEKEKRKEQETGKRLEKEKADTKKKATLEPKRKKQGKESANIIHTEISFPACTKTVLQK